MMKHLCETMLFATVSSNAALLTFIAGVLRKVMNDLDAADTIGEARRRMNLANVPQASACTVSALVMAGAFIG